MRFSRIVPNINTDRLSELKEFYQTHFDFKVTFESEGYLGLKAEGAKEADIGFMLPGPCQNVYGGGLTLGLEASDVDAEFERATEAGLKIGTPLNDAPWGDRFFTVIDPIGVALYIYKSIEPAEEFKEYFKE